MFPREQAINQHDLIVAASGGVFSEFDDELSNNGSSNSYSDFDYTEVPLPGQPQHGGKAHLIARPRPSANSSTKVWGRNARDDQWYEDIQVDGRGDMLDQQNHPVGGPATPVLGQCHNCGASCQLPGGATAQFCPSCGTQQPGMTAQVVPAHQLAGAIGQATACCNTCGAQGTAQAPINPNTGDCPSCSLNIPPANVIPQVPHAGPPPGYDPNRMTGRREEPVVIPEGLGKHDGKEDFFSFLDEAIAAGQEDKAEDKTGEPS